MPIILGLALLQTGCVTGLPITAMADTEPGMSGMEMTAASCGDPQPMQITPNSQTMSSSLANANNAMQISFRTADTSYWTAMVSDANTGVSLGTDRGNAVVTFQKGLTVLLSPRGGSDGFDLFLTGTIVDDSTVYTLTGAFLGHFNC